MRVTIVGADRRDAPIGGRASPLDNKHIINAAALTGRRGVWSLRYPGCRLSAIAPRLCPGLRAGCAFSALGVAWGNPSVLSLIRFEVSNVFFFVFARWAGDAGTAEEDGASGCVSLLTGRRLRQTPKTFEERQPDLRGLLLFFSKTNE